MIKSIGFRAVTVAGAALFMAVACASTRTQKSAGEGIDDAVIATSVKTALIGDPVTKARNIDVAVFKGRVQLNGFVDSTAEKAQAVVVAQKVNGVTGVEDNLKLKAAERTAEQALGDTAISVKVKAGLAADKRTEAHQIDVQTRNNVVLLGGFVDNAASRSAATDVAKAVEGVTSVDNQLAVK
jgi:hyperosmotically inducible protein